MPSYVPLSSAMPGGRTASGGCAADFGYFELWEILRVHCQYHGIDVPVNLPAGDEGERTSSGFSPRPRPARLRPSIPTRAYGWPGDGDQAGGGGPVPVGADGAGV